MTLVAGSVLSGFASQAAAAQNNNFDSCKIVQVNDNHAYAPFRHSYGSMNFEGTDGSGKYDISPEILEYLGFIKTGGRKIVNSFGSPEWAGVEWTGKLDINSRQDFLESKFAQECAMQQYRLMQAELQRHGCRDVNVEKNTIRAGRKEDYDYTANGSTSTGAYGFLIGTLKKAGFVKSYEGPISPLFGDSEWEDVKWTGKMGVSSRADFLSSPAAQECAASIVLNKNRTMK